MKRVVLQVKGNMHWGRKKHLDSDMANTCAHVYKVSKNTQQNDVQRTKETTTAFQYSSENSKETLSNFYLIFGTMQRGAQ